MAPQNEFPFCCIVCGNAEQDTFLDTKGVRRMSLKLDTYIRGWIDAMAFQCQRDSVRTFSTSLKMILTKGNAAVVLLWIVCISASVALPTVDEENLLQSEEKPVPASSKPKADEVKAIVPQGRYLLPADFAVKHKKFSIGTQGVGSFFRAWRNCIDEGKALATIESEREQKFLESMLEATSSGTNYWIAATNVGSLIPNKLTWITIDLPVKTKPSYLNVGAPSSCIALSSTGAWTSKNCFNALNVFPYICEEYF
uniref:C-type lectin domain-containing protein n=1 Tax=Anopheles christyi TaxID=43041 RepID=A0A182K7R2_9DIPT